MASRKKKPLSPPPNNGNGHAFAVVVEDLLAKFSAFGEKMDSLEAKMDRRFEQMDRRFEQIDRRFDGVEERIGRVESAILEHTRQLKDLRAAVDCKVDRDQLRDLLQRSP
jgi:predicted  nucleic acid-binding Zn-ribbon protein